MRRHRLLTAAAALTARALLPSPVSAEPASAAEYDLTTPSGIIFGSLTMPAKPAARVPAVLIIAGSGPTDRDGNAPQLHLVTDMYRELAEALAARGIATVRYDKRGIAASRAAMVSESALRFEDYVDDAAAWITKVRGDARFGRVAIAGHSEGSLIGMLAAKTAPLDAFVSLCGAGQPVADVLRAQLLPKLAAQPALAAESTRIIDALVAGKTTESVSPELAPLFRASVQPYLISLFGYDPRRAVLDAGKSVTIVGGTNDVQIPVADTRALATARPDAKLVLVEGMTHVLKISTDRAALTQAATVYTQASLPIAPQVTDAIAATFGR